MREGNPYFGATFAERAAQRPRQEQDDAKAVEPDEVEDKAVGRASTKTRKPAAKKG